MCSNTAVSKEPEATRNIKENEESSLMEVEEVGPEERGNSSKQRVKRKRRNKIRQKFTAFRILYNNINHLKSKAEALEKVVEEIDPTVVILVETKLPEEEQYTLDGYTPLQMNRNEYGGGVMLLVKEELENISVVVERDREVAEIMWVAMSNGRNKIRIGIVYAPQESKTKVEQLKVMYKKLEEQVKKAKTMGQNVLLVGDFNCKVGNMIEGNTEEISKSGKRLLKFVDKLGLKIMNRSKVCDGTWTRVEGNKKSVLDYFIINEEDEELVKCMLIDEEHNITPYHQEDGRKIFSDHNAMVMEVDWNMKYVSGCQTRMVMNETTKKEYKEETTNTKITDIWEKNLKPQEKYNLWDEEVVKIAESCFKKKRKKKGESKQIRILKRRKKKIKGKYAGAGEKERKILNSRKKLIDEHIEKLKKERKTQRTRRIAAQIKCEKGFDGGAFWEFKRRREGRKKEVMVAVKNESGEIEEEPEKIMEVYRNFYMNLLSGKDMENETGKRAETVVNKYIEALEKTARKTGIEPFTDEEYQIVKKGLKPRKAPDQQRWRYEYVKYGGKDLDESILKMVNEMITNWVIPEQWEEMIIKAISKNKGDLKTMNSKRGLFLTNIVSKVVEKLIKNRGKENVKENVSQFQCGGTSGRAISDNLLILNSAIEEYREKNEDMFVLFADLEKCFDKLWLRDCIKELVEAGMPIGEALYIYMMNKKVKATVETPVGRTKEFELKEIVRQGTVCAVDLCCVSTDRINKLEDDGPKLTVSGVPIKHPVFVDDMAAAGEKTVVENMEHKMKHLENTKKYTFNNEKGKSEIMRMELSKTKPKNKKKERNPVVSVKKGKIGYTEKYKYMGDLYDKTGKNLSKILKKMEKRNFICSEVKRMGSYNEVGEADTSVRMLLMETTVKQTLLFNTETWVNVLPSEMELIDRYHYEILRKVFEQRENVPYYGLLAETGYWPFSYIIIYKRLMFFHHLINSDERRISRQIVINQMKMEKKKNNWYGSVREWLERLEMETEEEEILEISKSRWKKELKEKLGDIVADEVEKKRLEMKKLRFSRGHEMQEYVKTCSMAKVKNIMKLRLNMTDLKANFKGKHQDTMCVACKLEPETTEHVIQCPEYRRIVGHSIIVNETVERCMQDVVWLQEASEVYERIEETRKWLVR